jgi:hypothetical protein
LNIKNIFRIYRIHIQRILKAKNKGPSFIVLGKGKLIITTADFSTEMLKARRPWNDI